MNELAPWLGTLPQWGTFGGIVMLLIAVLRYLPERQRVRNERARDEAAAEASAAEGWREIEARVSAELAECQQARERDVAHRQRIDDENFKLRIVLSMALDELDRLDPDSQIILKARAIMAVPSGAPDAPDLDRERMAELMAQLGAEPKPKRRQRLGRKKI